MACEGLSYNNGSVAGNRWEWQKGEHPHLFKFKLCCAVTRALALRSCCVQQGKHNCSGGQWE